jgi:hypothetical protein
MMPLRIASLLERDMSRCDGVLQKAVAQVTCWQEMGHTAKIFALSAGHAAATAVEDCEVDIEPWRRWRDWLTGYPRLIDRLIRWKPDIVYFRFSSFFPALHRLLRNVPTILEINTSDLDEYRNTMSWKAYTYHRATRRLLLGNARGLVTVTRQLAEAFRPLGKPIVAISNGIDLAGCPSFRAPQNARPRLVFLGQGCMPWHGTDKILHLAGLEPEWDFELIGLADCPLPEISSNVQLLPFLDRKNYRARLWRMRMLVSVRWRCTATPWMRHLRSRSASTLPVDCPH